MIKRKIGILTFHCAENFGAVLQCYALQDVLIAMGHDVEVIDYRPVKLAQPYRIFRSPFTGSSRWLYAFLRILAGNILLLSWRLSRRRKFVVFRRKYFHLTEQFHEPLRLKNRPGGYSHYIVGSDQVWNPRLTGDSEPGYFLDFDTGDAKRISYAASIGEAASEGKEEIFSRHVPKFDAISVREKSSVGYIQQFTDKKVEAVLDPTLLLSPNKWEKISGRRAAGRYLFVYDVWVSDAVVRIVDKVADALGLDVVSYQSKKLYKRGVRSFAYEGPEEFLDLLINSPFVITSSFHGTTLALVNKKKFLTIPHPVLGARMIDLLETLRLKDRIVCSPECLDKIDFAAEIDYRMPLEILESEKKKSLGFLRAALT